MGIINKLFGKSSRDASKNTPASGRKTQVSNGYTTTLSPYNSRTSDTLIQLRAIDDESTAIEFLKEVNPDVSMAVWNFVRLANQGNEMQLYALGKSKARMTNIEEQWRDFASRINEISNSGLDGLIDQLHYSSFLLGAMGCEVEVTPDIKDIYDVYVVKPKTIYWELGEIDNHQKWIPYQLQNSKKIYLDPTHANFFWVPADPKIGDPRGTLNLSPVLQAIDFQMQILEDMQAVLHHQGWPRDDYEINLERMLSSCPSHIKNNPKELQKWFQEQYDNVVNMLQKIKPDSDIIHFDDVKRNPSNNNANSRSLDVRAINEMVDVQTMSGLKQMSIFMNRNQGVTESWGTVQFRIFCSGITSCQRGSKRLIEEIARLWLRVNGIQAVPKFKHNTIDWNSEEQRMNVKLLEEKFYAIAVMMNWIDNDKAAQEVMKTEKAVGDVPIDQIKVSFSSGNDAVTSEIPRDIKKKEGEK